MKNWPINCCWGKTTRAAQAHCRTFKTSCCGTSILIKQPNCGIINIPHSHYRNQLALTCSGGRSPLLTRVSFQKPTHSPPSYCVLGVVTDKSPPHYLCSTYLTWLLFQVGSYCQLEVPEWASIILDPPNQLWINQLFLTIPLYSKVWKNSPFKVGKYIKVLR